VKLPFVERLAADPTALRGLRRRVRGALRGLRLPPTDTDTVLLVLDELVSNAIEHGAVYRKSRTPLHVSLETEGEDLVLEFADADMPSPQIAVLAKTFADGDIELPDFEDERGRGLFLVLTSMQAIVVEDRTAAGDGMVLRGRFVGVARP
jgi:anti-sigma regulatory factor (Ser/Thr protein kinase)